MAKVCIVCAKEVASGYPVEDDIVIRTIRGIKRYFKVARNNQLVVSEECLEEYKKKREKYEKNLVMHVVLGAGVLIIFALLPIFTSGFSVWALLLGILLAAMVVGLSVFSHFPKIAEGAKAKAKMAGGRREARKTKKK